MKDMLEGLKVLDLGNNVAGPLAAAMLADYGADVIHVEKPILGDDARAYPPKVDGVSLAYCWLNRGKKSVVLDMKDPAAIDIIKKIAADVDVVVESSRPGVMARLGLDYQAIKQVKPDIVYCSVSAFGQTGPYAKKAGYDVIAQAFSGFMNLTGYPDGPPMKSNVAIGDIVGAINAFGSIMAALYYRQMTGIGQNIDVSLARGLLFANTPFDRLNIGVSEKRTGNHDPALNPYGVYEGSNGQSVVIAAISANLWEKLCKIMGREDMIDDPRFCENSLRAKNRHEVIPVIEDWLKKFEKIEDAIALLDKAGVPNIKVYSHDDIAKDPHALECGWLVEAPVQNGITSIDKYLTRNVAATFSETPGTIKKAAALGEDNYEVLTKYGLTREQIDELQAKWSNK
ncbi:MAG: CoA transferase [Firmicutes bacterium]|nr:CoA transferase [Bacillota bacterium]